MGQWIHVPSLNLASPALKQQNPDLCESGHTASAVCSWWMQFGKILEAPFAVARSRTCLHHHEPRLPGSPGVFTLKSSHPGELICAKLDL
ncbi:hypothetical protein A2415_03800 [candidate division WWE3 bacterium RIFOXYC1_FULL_39_7]|uniref:Uncharacterized protein n=1 Tax=candidate division WWE3 bacterium RIFOXYC1_FULL_39_7 TaxID=1802643 RepID=A0A1F4WMT9_UNCKA|nr:MAG: hypothetical protein A2415_03800 [candidate division WWE3 bacterium RIFOXYC1_FULL_39_7]